MALSDWRDILGRLDVVLMTFDTLRYDVAMSALARGLTPNLERLLCGSTWEERHTPATFTFPAHQSFFAGFLPTPAADPQAPRSIALRFAGSHTIDQSTLVFDAPSIVEGFAQAGYHTVCIGGTGFFNPSTPLGRVLPALFAESHWSRPLGVAEPRSPHHQLTLAAERLAALPTGRRAFLFINISATHRPTTHYLPGACEESVETQAAALAAVDRRLPILLAAIAARGGARAILCADHGTCFGEDGRVGHRLAHPLVTTVPYAEVALP